MLNEFPCSLVLETYVNNDKYCLLGYDALLNLTDVSEKHTLFSGSKNETSELREDLPASFEIFFPI
jgi:hypothetical protein